MQYDCVLCLEKDVLIHICYQKINADCPSLGNAECFPVQILVVHFNTLYINGKYVYLNDNVTVFNIGQHPKENFDIKK